MTNLSTRPAGSPAQHPASAASPIVAPIAVSPRAAHPAFARRPRNWRNALAPVLAVALLYESLITKVHTVVTPMLCVLLAAWVSEMRGTDRTRRTLLAAIGTLFVIVNIFLSRVLAHAYQSDLFVIVGKSFFLQPAGVILGWQLARVGRLTYYLRWLLAVGLVTVLFAVVEYETGKALLQPAKAFVRSGHLRALVGAEHPLVLGTILLSLVPVALATLGRWRWPAALWLFVGVYVTGSNGPTIIGAVLLVTLAVPPIARRLTASAKPFLVLLAGLTAYITYGALRLWSLQIPGTTSRQVSNEYRASLYSILPSVLTHHPFGYGITGLPPSTYLVRTAANLVDVADSIDSELVLGVTQFGYMWVAVFVTVAIFGALAVPHSNVIGLSSLLVTLAGLFLAIHSWNSLGVYWMLLFGGCLATVLPGGRRQGDAMSSDHYVVKRLSRARAQLRSGLPAPVTLPGSAGRSQTSQAKAVSSGRPVPITQSSGAPGAGGTRRSQTSLMDGIQ